MHIEKSSQENKLPRKNSDKSTQIFSRFYEFTFLKLEKIIIKKRLALRINLRFTPFNIGTLISILPFALGFSQFLGHKYKNHITKYFFEKNLPTITIPTEKLDWETIEYVFKSNLHVSPLKKELPINSQFNILTLEPSNKLTTIKEPSNQQKTNQIYSYENLLFLNKNLFCKISGQQKFIGKIKNKNLISKSSFNGLWAEFFNINSKTSKNSFNSFENFYRELDELPAFLGNFFEPTDGISKNFNKNQPILNVEKFGSPLNFINLTNLNKKTKLVTKNSNKKKETLKLITSLPSKTSNYLDKLSFLSIPGLNKTIIEKTIPLVPEVEVLSITNQLYISRNEFYKNFISIKKELQNFLLEKTLIPSPSSGAREASKMFDNQKLEYSPSLSLTPYEKFMNLEIDDKVFIERLLKNLDTKMISKEFLHSRPMSGYSYPDMKKSEIQWFLIQNKYFSRSNENNFEIKLPSIFSLSTNYNFSIPEKPSFLIESKSINLSDFEKKETLYRGPALVLDSEKSLDWNSKLFLTTDTEKIKNKFLNLRSWFKLYFSQYNPLLKNKENFFGLYDSPEYISQSANFNNSDWSLENLPISNNRFLSDLEFNFLPNELNTQIPFITGNEWQTKYADLKKTKSELTAHIIPLLQTQSPKIHSISNKSKLKSNTENLEQSIDKTFSFNLQNNKNLHFNLVKSYSPLFDLGRTGNLDYKKSSKILNYFKNLNPELAKPVTSIQLSPRFTIENCLSPVSDSLVNQQNFSSTIASGRYKKTPSIYSKRQGNELIFHDNWEPLTYRSWLIISQISFAFLVFCILKALADNYGRELLVYLLDLVAALGFLDDALKQEIEILMGQREKGFRIISKTTKTFNDIAGIKNVLPEISEIVWFLRNSAREFAISKTLPRGILLTGPPGTGKTLLVQALAGEARVPVLVLSGSSLIEPGESNAVKLEILFQEARRLAPSIVFIDEIDTLAQKREQVIQNPMGPDEIIESLIEPQSPVENSNFPNLKSFPEGSFTQHNISVQQESRKEQLSLLMQLLVELDGIQGRDGVIVIGATNRPEILDPAILRPGRFDKVLELGLPGQQKRMEILKLYGNRLGYQNSISWQYFAERTVGFTAADLATIMNESSLKAILTETTHTIETIEHGIDRVTTAFQFDTTSTSNTKSNKSLYRYQILTTRLAYYQAGKILLSHILKHHPEILVAHLWPRRSNIRSLQIAKNLQNYFFKIARRIELEHRILGCYAGKAAEVLFLHTFSSIPDFSNLNGKKSASKLSSNISNLGLEDLIFAQTLIIFITEKWSLYSKKSSVQKTTRIAEDFNCQQFSIDKAEFYSEIAQSLENAPNASSVDLNELALYNSQEYFSTAWWQDQISSELEFVERDFADWSRLYLPNPEERELNPDWVPPDEFYHTNIMTNNLVQENIPFGNSRNKHSLTSNTNSQLTSTFSGQELLYLQGLNTKRRSTQHSQEKLNSNESYTKLNQFQSNKSLIEHYNQILSVKKLGEIQKSRVNWNDVSSILRDYQIHSIVLQSFNKALLLLDKNRELLDRISIELLYSEVLRKPTISKLIENFILHNSGTSISSIEDEEKFDNKSSSSGEFQEHQTDFKHNSSRKVESAWGKNSRKKISRWIDFASLRI